MKRLNCIFALAALLLATFIVQPLQAQRRTPVVATKARVASVVRTATGSFWAAAQTAFNHNAALIRVVPTGSPSACTIEIRTGPLSTLATKVADDRKATIDCTTDKNVLVGAIDEYWNAELTTFTGGTNVTIYVALTNFTIPRSVTVSNGTNDMPAGDAQARAISTSPGDGTNAMPAGDVQARAINVTPGDGTNAFADITGGVGALGAGVQQVGEVNTLSAAISDTTLTEVVAAPGAGSIYLRGLVIEKSAGAVGVVTVQNGTGTNCGTGTATIVVLTDPQIGFTPLGILVPATNALCLKTEAVGTVVRSLTN